MALGDHGVMPISAAMSRRVPGFALATALAAAAVAGCGGSGASAPAPTSSPTVRLSATPSPSPATTPVSVTGAALPKAPRASASDAGAIAYTRYFIRLYYVDYARRDLTHVTGQILRPGRSTGLRDAAAAVKALVETGRFQAPGRIEFARLAVTAHQSPKVVVDLSLRTAAGVVYDDQGDRVATLRPQRQTGQVLLRWSSADKVWQVIDFALDTTSTRG